MFGLKSNKDISKRENKEVSNELIYYHEDFTSEQLSERSVGRKGLSLFKLRDMDIPVPEFFVLSPTVYRDILFKSFDEKILKLAEGRERIEPKNLSNLVNETPFSTEFQEGLLKAYTRLSGFSDSWVAVRSSLVLPDHPEVSFAGIFTTELNVRGFSNLLEGIKSIYLSIFDPKVVNYAKSKGVSLSNLQMSVVVQKMIQAEVSGITFTVDPVTNYNSIMSIEAVFGLGDVIADGEITPDLYLLSKGELGFEEKHISPQNWMKVLKPGVSGGSKVEKVQISSNWSHQQKLEDRFIKEIAKVSMILEEKSGEPQNIEWAWESGRVWVLQNKPIEKRSDDTATQEAREEMSKIRNIEPKESDELTEMAVGIAKAAKIEEGAVSGAVDVLKKKRDKVNAEVKVEKKEIKQNLGLVGKDIKIQSNSVNVKSSDIEKNGTADSANARTDGKENEKLMEELGRIEDRMKEFELEEENKNFQSSDAEDAEVKSSNVHIGGTDGKEEVEADSVPAQKEDEKKLVVKGTGGSFGIKKGKVIKYENGDLAELKVSKNSILLVRDYKSEMQSTVLLAGGIITEEGGLTSDIAIICRESGIPAILDADGAFEALKTGDWVEIDGSTGVIYKFSNDRADALESDLDEFTPLLKVKQSDVEEEKGSPEEEFKEKKLEKKKSKFSDLDTLMGLKKKIASGYEKMLDREVASELASEADGAVEGEKKYELEDLDKSKKRLSEVIEQIDKSNSLPKQKEDLSVKKTDLSSDEDEAFEKSKQDNEQEIEPENEVEAEEKIRKTATKVMLSITDHTLDKVKKEMKYADGIGFLDFDKFILEAGDHPMSSIDDGTFVEYSNSIAGRVDKFAEEVNPDEVVLVLGTGTSKEFADLARGRKYENLNINNNTKGLKRYLKNARTLKNVLKIIRRIRNVFKSRNVSVGIYMPENGEMMKEFKKELSVAGLQRTTTFNVYPVISRSSEVLLLDDILLADVDGVIVDMTTLAEELGDDDDMENIKGVLNKVFDTAKDHKAKVVLKCCSKELVKYGVDKGAYGVSVKPEDVKNIRELVANEEAEMVLKS